MQQRCSLAAAEEQPLLDSLFLLEGIYEELSRLAKFEAALHDKKLR